MSSIPVNSQLPTPVSRRSSKLDQFVDVEGFIVYEGNQYSVPWQLVGQVLPARITETELIVYDCHMRQIARHRHDVVQAMERAIRYHAYSLSSLERILNMQATPKASWQIISEGQQDTLRKLPSESDSIEARSSAQYQYLLFEENDSDGTATKNGQSDTSQPTVPAPGDAKHPSDD